MPDQLDKFRVTCYFDMPGSVQAQTVFHVHQEGITTTTDDDFMDACRDQLRDGWWNPLRSFVDTEVLFDRIQFDEVDFEGKIVRYVGQRSVGVAGLSAAQMIPHMDAALQLFSTLTPKVHGRKFVPGITEANQESGLLSSGALASLASSLATVLAGFTVSPSTQWYFGVISSVLNDFTAFSTLGKATNLIATQRRRRIGRGS